MPNCMWMTESSDVRRVWFLSEMELYCVHCAGGEMGELVKTRDVNKILGGL